CDVIKSDDNGRRSRDDAAVTSLHTLPWCQNKLSSHGQFLRSSALNPTGGFAPPAWFLSNSVVRPVGDTPGSRKVPPSRRVFSLLRSAHPARNVAQGAGTTLASPRRPVKHRSPISDRSAEGTLHESTAVHRHLGVPIQPGKSDQRFPRHPAQAPGPRVRS